MEFVSASEYGNILDEIVDNIRRRGGSTQDRVDFNRSDKIDHSHADINMIANQSLLRYITKPVQDSEIPIKGSLLLEHFFKAMGQIRDDFKYNHICTDCLGVCVSCVNECVSLCSSCYSNCAGGCWGGCISGSNWSEGSSCFWCTNHCDTWCAGRCDNNCCWNCQSGGCSTGCQNNCADHCGYGCQTGCSTMCNDACSLSCGTGCAEMARIGALATE